MAAEIGQYLTPGTPPQVWREALEFEGVLDLPEAQECIARALQSDDDLSVQEALWLIGDFALEQFAEQALQAFADCQGDAPDDAASHAVLSLGDTAAILAGEMLVREAQALGGVMGGLSFAMVKAGYEGDKDAPAHAARRRLARIRRLLCIVRADNAVTVGDLACAMSALLSASYAVGVHCTVADAAELVMPIADELALLQAGPLRALCAIDAPGAWEHVRDLAGRYVLDIKDTPRARDKDDEVTSWGGLIADLRETAEQLARAQLAVMASGDGLPVELAGYQLAPAIGWCGKLQYHVIQGQIEGAKYRDEAAGALRSTQQREHHARKALVRAIGEEALARLQRTWSRYHHSMTHLNPQAVSRSARAACALPAQHLTAAARLFAEYNTQCALIGVLAHAAEAADIPAIMARLNSECGLVVQSAENALALAGPMALPALRAAIAGEKDPTRLAHLLEVVRCIDPAAVLAEARRLVVHPDDLLATAAARIIGEAGGGDDVPALQERAETGDELLRATVLRAMADIDPVAHIETFKTQVTSPELLVRLTAIAAIAACPEDIVENTANEFSSRTDTFHITTAEALSIRETWADLPFGPIPAQRHPLPDTDSMAYRLAEQGPGPWQWGILCRSPFADCDWRRYHALINSDDELIDLWDEFTDTGRHPERLGWLLREIALSDGDLAGDALRLLRGLLGPGLSAVAAMTARYHGLDETVVGDDSPQVDAALRDALVTCTPRLADDLTWLSLVYGDELEEVSDGLEAVDAHGRPPAGGPQLGFDLDDEDHAPGECEVDVLDGDETDRSSGGERERADSDTMLINKPLMYLFARSLARELGVAPVAISGVAEDRIAAFEAEWKALQAYTDAALGFVVQPR